MADEQLWRLGASDIVERVTRGEVSVRDVVASTLERLDDVNPMINAVPEVYATEALARADQLDSAIESGQVPGGLVGVPVTIKPNVDMAGKVTHCGSPALSQVAREDSLAVAGLREAGAVVIGRTNMPELAMRWTTDGPLHGATVNPWNPDIVPGGSSGGAAAAVATGIGAIAHGNDLGGSLRQPAACCGVAAIRPTSGRLPYRMADSYPSIDAQLMGVDGPIARTIEDAWLGLRAMLSSASPEPLAAPVALLDPDMAESLRVAVVVDPDGEGVDPSVGSAVTAAADVLARSGHMVVEARIPPIAPLASLRNDIVWAKVRFAMEELRPASSDAIKAVWDGMIQATSEVDLAGYFALLTERAERMREWDVLFGDVDVILAPVSTELPFEVGADSAGGDRFAQMLHALRVTLATVLTGLPAATVPAGITAAGAPLGVQVVAGRWREDRAVTACSVVQRELGLPTPIDPQDRLRSLTPTKLLK